MSIDGLAEQKVFRGSMYSIVQTAVYFHCANEEQDRYKKATTRNG
jgi:uncharacterized membrane protein (DUF485 family)